MSTAHRGDDTSSSSFRKLLSFKRSQRLRQDQLDFLCDTTRISEAEIRKKYKTFLESHPAGEISHDSFNALLSECFPKTYLENIRYIGYFIFTFIIFGFLLIGLYLAFPLVDNLWFDHDLNLFSQHIWRMYDVNMDGVIDFQEFLIAINIMSNGTPEENLEQIFRFFDVNRNGFIDKLEMESVVEDLLALETCLDMEDIAQEAFREMDENEDSRISLDEFVNACLSNKKCSSVLTMKVVNLFLSK